MFRVYKILIVLFCLIFYSCDTAIKIKQEIDDTNAVIEKTLALINSEELKKEQNKLENAKTKTENLSVKIDNLKKTELSNAKDSIIQRCDNQLNFISNLEKEVVSHHGINKEGELMNRSESKFINEIFIKEGKGIDLKKNISETISKFVAISNENNLNISKDSLPLQLNLLMEKENKKWENYTFENMPAGAIEPILRSFKSKIILSKIMLLESLASK